jgi:hypothetical protein
MDHCRHCPGPDDPRHDELAGSAADEAACAFYEKPENLIPSGPPVRRRRRTTVSIRYEPPSCGPQTFTMAG